MKPLFERGLVRVDRCIIVYGSRVKLAAWLVLNWDRIRVLLRHGVQPCHRGIEHGAVERAGSTSAHTQNFETAPLCLAKRILHDLAAVLVSRTQGPPLR